MISSSDLLSKIYKGLHSLDNFFLYCYFLIFESLKGVVSYIKQVKASVLWFNSYKNDGKLAWLELLFVDEDIIWELLLFFF